MSKVKDKSKYIRMAKTTVWVSIMVLMLLFIFCQNINKYNFTKVNGDHYPKATIAQACNLDKTVCLNNVLLIEGVIDENTEQEFLALLKTMKDKPRAICFHSPGGIKDVAVNIGTKIKMDGLSTCLAERYVVKGRSDIKNVKCNSSCPMVFLTGKERLAIGYKTDIFVHHSGYTLSFCFKCIKANTLEYIAFNDFESLLRKKPEEVFCRHKAFLKMTLDTKFKNELKMSFDSLSKYLFFSHRVINAELVKIIDQELLAALTINELKECKSNQIGFWKSVWKYI
jgi:hypothetical protein